MRFRYEDFGPTLAQEKLTELHDLSLSVETLRHWMIEDGLWIPRARRERQIQQPRRRRPCRGELIKEQQRERTEAKVAKPSTTRRDARLLRAGTPRRMETGTFSESQA